MDIAITPTRNDILFGRGNGTNHHKGNKEFRALIQSKKEDYANAKPGGKGLISKIVLDTIHDRNGRFLAKEKTKPGQPDRWTIVTEKQALTKISQALREIEKKKSGELNDDKKENSPSSTKKKTSMSNTLTSSPKTSKTTKKKKATRRKSSAVENLLAGQDPLMQEINDFTPSNEMGGMLLPLEDAPIVTDPRLNKTMPALPSPRLRRPSRKMSLPKRWAQQFQSKKGEKNLLGDFDFDHSLRGGPTLPQASVSKFDPKALNWDTKRNSFLRSQQSIEKEHIGKKKRPSMLSIRGNSIDLEDGMNLLISRSKLSDVGSSSKNLLSHLLVPDASHIYENDEFERLANMISSVNELSLKDGNELSSLDTKIVKETMLQLSSTRVNKVPNNMEIIPSSHPDAAGLSDVLDSKLTMDFSDKSYALGGGGDGKTKPTLDANMSLRSLGQFSSDNNFASMFPPAVQDSDEEKTNQILNIAL